MTTPQWTVDNGVLYTPKRFCLTRNDDLSILSPEEYAALVADVAAARLVDDIAAVVRRYSAGWIVAREDEQWFRIDIDDEARTAVPTYEPMSPGEVAALHHARRQEGT